MLLHQKKIFALSLVFIAFISSSISFAPTAYTICKKAFATSKTIKTLTYTMVKQERVEQKLLKQSSFTKVQLKPFKAYVKQLAPKKGLEVLYVTGKNDNKALINPNGFPWVNVSLDPMSSTMRKNQHHTLYDSGFDLVISILEHLFEKYGEETKSMIKLLKSQEYMGEDCWVISLDNTKYKIINYKVKKGEDVVAIAKKYKLSEYSIVELNDNVDDFDDVKENQIIKIPNDYSPKMTLYIEKKRNIPRVMKVYDDKGLYEYYRYTSVSLNPTFSDKDFSKENKDYGF